MSPRRQSSLPPMTAMGRQVIHHSPAKHPEASDPLAAPPNTLTEYDRPDVPRSRPTYERREGFDREARLDFTEGGPGRGDKGSESYNAAMKRRTRVANLGKRGFKRNEYGSGGVS